MDNEDTAREEKTSSSSATLPNSSGGSDSISVSHMSVLSYDSIVSGDAISMDNHEVYVAAGDIRYWFVYT